MNWLTRLSLRNAAAVVIVALLVTAGGVWSAMRLEQETMPDVSVPIVVVTTAYPGASPRDVLQDVTEPVEDALAAVTGIEHLDSTSSENVSIVVAQFSFSEDMEAAKQQVGEAVARLDLPEAAMDPRVSRWSFGSAPIMRVSVSNSTLEPASLYGLVRRDVLPKVAGIDGVAEVQTGSSAEESVYVKLLPAKLAEHHLTAQQVQQQLQAANLSYPVGSVRMGDLNKPVRVTGSIDTTGALAEMRIMLQADVAQNVKQAMGQFSGGISQLGQAVSGLGQGLRGAALGLNGEVQLTASIIEIQRSLLEAKIALSEVNAMLIDSDTTPAQKQAATTQKTQLTAQVAGLEATLAGLKNQLSLAQSSLTNQINAPSATSTGTPGASTSATSSAATSSTTSASGVQLVRLGDVAEITAGTGELSSYSRTNGRRSVVLEVQKGQDANTVEVADDVRAKIEDLERDLPAGTNIDYVYDASEAVRSSIGGMYREGLLGALFAFLVILVFLRNFRATIISAVSIPLSILISMVFIRQAGITLNVMTLGGLTVAIGRVVDDSIVVIENIYRRFSTGEERTPELIRQATGEVASAITSSTLTTAAVFVPLALVSGVVGKVFQPFALTVGIALMASLLVSVTVVPLMARGLIKSKIRVDVDGDGGRMARGYRRMLGWSLRHKWVVMLVSVLLLAGTAALVPFVGTGFMPEDDVRYVNIDVELPEGTPATVVDDLAKDVERKIASDEAVDGYQTSVGAPSASAAAFSSMGSNRANLFVKLTDEADVDDVLAKWRRALEPLGPADAIKVTDAGHQIVGGSSAMEVAVLGDDIDEVKVAAETLTQRLKGIEGLGEPTNNLGRSKPEIAVEVDQAKAADRALSAGQVAQTVRGLLADETVGQAYVGGEKVDLKLGLKLDPVGAIEDMQRIGLVNPLGETISLSAVATVAEVPGPVAVYTRDGVQYAVVRADILSRDTGKVNSAVEEAIELTELPEGVTTEIGGSAQQMAESFEQMGIAMLVAIGAVYLVMVLTFGEATAPLAILVSLPLATIGAVGGLFVARQPLNMPAMVGALMLIGLVVTNAIVLVDRVQTNRSRRGMALRDALIEAGGVRMRPILMTALTTVIALVPLALGLSDGSMMSQSLAAIVIGGMTTSTLLTLVAVPVAYESLERLFHAEVREEFRRMRRAELLGEGEPAPEAPKPRGERRSLFARKPKPPKEPKPKAEKRGLFARKPKAAEESPAEQLAPEPEAQVAEPQAQPAGEDWLAELAGPERPAALQQTALAPEEAPEPEPPTPPTPPRNDDFDVA